jgi:hypothetical protein
MAAEKDKGGRERARKFMATRFHCYDPNCAGCVHDVEQLAELLASEAALARREERLEIERIVNRVLADAKEINGYAVNDSGGMGERLLKVAAHTTGMTIRLERELAAIHERNREEKG